MTPTTVTLIVAIIAAGATFLTALITFLTVLITKHKERTAAIAQENRLRMIPIYDDILSSIAFTLAAYVNEKVPPRNPALTQKVATWASNEVLKLYLDVFEECRKTDASRDDQLVPLFSDMVLAIRNDLGYKKAHLNDAVKNRIGAGVLLDYLISSSSQQQAEPQPD